MRIGAILVTAAFLAGSAHAAPLDNAGSWRSEGTESYRIGFVAAVAQDLMIIQDSQPNGAAIRTGYVKCLNDQRMDTLLRVADAYLDRNPEENTLPPIVAVRRAIYEMCKSSLPTKTK
jgi:hypothetical protein